MVQFHCLNPIAACGLELFPDTYKKTDDFNADQKLHWCAVQLCMIWNFPNHCWP